MAALGYFDPALCPSCWFDPEASEAVAWFDTDLIVCGGAPPAVVEEEERSAWSDYRRRTTIQLVRREPILLEHEPDGGLELGGQAYCQQYNAPRIRRRWVIPQGRLGAHAGAALFQSGKMHVYNFAPSGGLDPFEGRAAVSVSHTLRMIGSGDIAGLSGQALCERGRRMLRLVA